MARPLRLLEAAGFLQSFLAAKEADVSFSTRTALLNDALCDSDYCPHSEEDYCSCWVVDVFDTYFVFRSNGETYRLGYSIGADNSVAFSGEPVEVIPVMTYPDAPADPTQAIESGKKKKKAKGSPFVERAEAELVGDAQPFEMSLSEAFLSEAATAMVKLIAPGWGSSGYYGPSVLQKAAAVFKKGTQMFIDHPTAAEEAARPEGSVLNLGGELIEDARWREDLPSGPGLYAAARVFDRFKDSLRDLKDSIGVSIRAFGMTHQGEAEGRKGPIVDSISVGRSVDFVTVPGAGGRVIDMIESRRAKATGNPAKEQQTTMTAEEQSQFDELKKQNAALLARMDEAQRLADAKTKVAAILETIKMPEATRKRLAESLPATAPTKDGKLDEAALKTYVEEAAATELRYIESLGNTGIVKGAGSTFTESSAKPEAITEAEDKAFTQTLNFLRGRPAQFEEGATATRVGR